MSEGTFSKEDRNILILSPQKYMFWVLIRLVAVRSVNPGAAEPGYVLPLQTV